MFVLCYLCVFLLASSSAADKCFCSATGDPHIRSLEGATSNVGAGEYTLIEDTQNKLMVEITVAQTSPTLTQIMSVDVNLAGDVVENIPGYGQVHRANGVEIRVLKNNNVFLIYDPSKGVNLKSTGTLCGGTCGGVSGASAVAAATAPQKKAVTLVKEIKKQQMELENLNVAQVTTDFAVNDMKNVVNKMKQQEKKEEKRLKNIQNAIGQPPTTI